MVQEKQVERAKTILVVDDERDAVRYLTLVLEDNGYTVLAADNVDDALHLLQTCRPSLICLDVVMPKKPGIVLYRKIRGQKQWAQIPVVLISGMSDPKQFDFSALAPGNNLPEPEAYLEKPIKVSLLLETVKRLTE